MGKDEGKLMYPCSLKIDSEGDLYIVDEGEYTYINFYFLVNWLKRRGHKITSSKGGKLHKSLNETVTFPYWHTVSCGIIREPKNSEIQSW